VAFILLHPPGGSYPLPSRLLAFAGSAGASLVLVPSSFRGELPCLRLPILPFFRFLQSYPTRAFVHPACLVCVHAFLLRALIDAVCAVLASCLQVESMFSCASCFVGMGFLVPVFMIDFMSLSSFELAVLGCGVQAEAGMGDWGRWDRC